MGADADLPSEEEVLRETLAALEMPAHGLRQWFRNNRNFCEAHGGRRIYGELLALLEDCERTLAEQRPGAAASPVTPTGDQDSIGPKGAR